MELLTSPPPSREYGSHKNLLYMQLLKYVSSIWHFSENIEMLKESIKCQRIKFQFIFPKPQHQISQTGAFLPENASFLVSLCNKLYSELLCYKAGIKK